MPTTKLTPGAAAKTPGQPVGLKPSGLAQDIVVAGCCCQYRCCRKTREVGPP